MSFLSDFPVAIPFEDPRCHATRKVIIQMLPYPWVRIAGEVAAGSAAAFEDLYQSLSSIRYYIARQVGGEYVDDIYHDVIVCVTSAIRAGSVHTPDAIPSFARTIAQRRVYGHISEAISARSMADSDTVVLRDRSRTPEQELIAAQNTEIAMRLLRALPKRDREVLVRFYLNEEPAAEIQRTMGLTATQFRLIKSRAKARFGELGRTRIARRGPQLATSIDRESLRAPTALSA